MKKLVSLFLLILSVAFASLALAADPASVQAAAPSFLAWFTANTAVILGVALAISELLAVVPAFKGNGILDTIIKALQELSKKPEA